MSCSGTFSLHIGKKPKKGKQSRDGRHFRQTVNQMTGIRDDYLSSEDEEDSKKLVTFASTHQGDSDQPLYHYPGQQCAGTRTKRAALLQRCRMASRSAAE